MEVLITQTIEARDKRAPHKFPAERDREQMRTFLPNVFIKLVHSEAIRLCGMSSTPFFNSTFASTMWVLCVKRTLMIASQIPSSTDKYFLSQVAFCHRVTISLLA